LNAYGASKEAGEREVRVANPKHVILRTAWVYAAQGHNFLRTMIRLAGERDLVRVVSDQHGTPTAAQDLARTILSIATALEETSRYGTYHATNAGLTSWFDFAEQIFAGMRTRGMKTPQLSAITTLEYPTPARRPQMSALDCGKLAEHFGISLRPWAEAVDETLGVIFKGKDTQ
jgi:dTDP-4-dehydrorhamnose reductase